MARPPSRSPSVFYFGTPGAQFGPTGATPVPAVPADLFESWRGLQISLTRSMPFHLNRAVTVMNSFKSAVR